MENMEYSEQPMPHMFKFRDLLTKLLEGVAITVAVYLTIRKEMTWKEAGVLVLTITVVFLLLDLFAPGVSAGARQGTGFGLGISQIAGAGDITLPRQYYEDNSQQQQQSQSQPTVPTGIEDKIALDYANKHIEAHAPVGENESDYPINADSQVPSTILQKYAENPFPHSTN